MTIDTLAMLFPNVAVTREIAVRVAVSYLSEQSDPAANRWFWSYHVRIEMAVKSPCNCCRAAGPSSTAGAPSTMSSVKA